MTERLPIFIDPGWKATGERLLPLARYLFGIREPALPTFRDEFVHNMPFPGVELASDPADAAFLYLPVAWDPELAPKHPVLTERLEGLSQQVGKVIICEANTADVHDPDALRIPFTNYLYLNPSLLRSCKPDRFHAPPYFIPDCLEKYCGGEVAPISKPTRPTVGFCGVAAPFATPFNRTKVFDWFRLAATMLDSVGVDSERLARSLGTNLKHAHRAKSILRLKNSHNVDFRFMLRAAGGLVSNEYTNLPDSDPYNTDYYANLRQNLYSLCTRGTENYSVRFYETFCMGRVPVLIDTDVVLPFESEIDYDRQCVLVGKSHVRRIDRAILDYNQSRSLAEIVEIQMDNRRIWERHFSNVGYYRELARYAGLTSNRPVTG